MKNVFAAIRAPPFHGLDADPFQNSAAGTLRRLVLIGLASTKKNRAARESGRCWGAEKPQSLPDA